MLVFLVELHWQETPWKQMLIESYCFHSIQPSFLSQRTNVTSNRKELDFPTKSAELHMRRNRHNMSLKSARLMGSFVNKKNQETGTVCRGLRWETWKSAALQRQRCGGRESRDVGRGGGSFNFLWPPVSSSPPLLARVSVH